MHFKKLLTVAASTAILATSVLVSNISQASAVDVYTEPGYHNVNGREWRTTCEPYSQTERCRTEIKATQVTVKNGKFFSSTGWVFNNLTYKASPREMWKSNPLGFTGSWTAKDGRKWRTECDTAVTGKNGCRSYIRADMVESFLDKKGNRNYKWVNKEVFNNMVRFSAPKVTAPTPKPTVPPVKPTPTKPPVTPKPTPTPTPTKPPVTTPPAVNVVINDAALNTAIRSSLNLAANAPINATSVTELYLGYTNLVNISELEKFPNLQIVELGQNNIVDATVLSRMQSLKWIGLSNNKLSNISSLLQSFNGLNNLEELYLADSNLNDQDVTPLFSMKKLKVLDLAANNLVNVSRFNEMTGLTLLSFTDNAIVTVPDFTKLTKLSLLSLAQNNITDVTPLKNMVNLKDLNMYDTNVSPANRSVLDGLVARGLSIYWG